MLSWKYLVLTGLLMAATLLPAQEQKRTYQSFNANVPFAFSIGERKFHAGYYEFVVAGQGVMAMRDAHARVLATLITRQLQGEERDVEPRFVFEQKNGHTRLVSIWMKKGTQGFEIVKEEVAMRQTEEVSTMPTVLRPPIVDRMPSLLH